MPCFLDEAKQLLTSDGRAELYEGLEKNYRDLLGERADFIQYGKPEDLSDRRRAKLNCYLLKQVLVHRAEQLMVGTGTMLSERS
jgi:hypothetical protein